MAHDRIVTVFDTRQEAEVAKRNLENAGFSEGDISLIMGEDLRTEGEEIRHPSIWRRLFGETVADEDAAAYMHALDINGVVLAVRASDSEADRAESILHDHHYGRLSSVVGRSTDAALLADDNVVTPGVGEVLGVERTTRAVRDTDYAKDVKDKDVYRDDKYMNDGKDEVIRLAEEKLEVGKRVVSEGETRIRRYVTQKDVEAEVTLHEEHADIFRRAVKDGFNANDIDWTDKVVKVTETREQPVVNKAAQVVEEVVVRKSGSDRVEKVNDTVRRQEVEIDRVNTNGDKINDTDVEPYDINKNK